MLLTLEGIKAHCVALRPILMKKTAYFDLIDMAIVQRTVTYLNQKLYPPNLNTPLMTKTVCT